MLMDFFGNWDMSGDVSWFNDLRSGFGVLFLAVCLLNSLIRKRLSIASDSSKSMEHPHISPGCTDHFDSLQYFPNLKHERIMVWFTTKSHLKKEKTYSYLLVYLVLLSLLLQLKVVSRSPTTVSMNLPHDSPLTITFAPSTISATTLTLWQFDIAIEHDHL